MNWESQHVRDTFFDFFRSKGHEIEDSAPMVVKNDPSLMFINAGMNQFKDVFLGISRPESRRIANVQKCLRVSGKHNDLEEVGVDTYHHTMFEMLGNWSFGDYFKKEAIDWAWELLTTVYKIDKDRLYVTVFEGADKESLPADQEAMGHWKTIVPEDRIIFGSKKDNFWEMGETGPCGPSSEIHVDIRKDEEREKQDGRELVNIGHPEVIEIWNLVFMQYNRLASGELQPLPEKHVDTGMGFERLCVVLQGKRSNYDTDIFTSLINKIETISGINYGSSDSTDTAMRVIADHVRAVSFSIADGQLPSNTGAGYVIRRILRRAIRYGYSFFELKTPFIYQLVQTLVDRMGAPYGEIKTRQQLIEKVIREEEEAFLRTLSAGMDIFKRYVQNMGKEREIAGSFAFELYDTFGFPIDLTQLMAREKNLQVDMEGFYRELEKQKKRSRQAAAVDTGDWVILLNDIEEEFIGYDQLESHVKISRYRKVMVKGKALYQLVFNLTPFYPEGGGQVGDTGYMEANDEKIAITDTKKEHNLIIHVTEKMPADAYADFRVVVDKEKRLATTNNHSATHLLHQALREVLGTHVEQRGSLVHPDYLRFDFSHFSKLTPEEVGKIEAMVNARIREDFPLMEKREAPLEEAKEMGALALFGEKYGDVVRVIQFGESVELCGGTHVAATGKIGWFKITTETSVASGIRRMEAVTAEKAEAFVQRQISELNEIKTLLKSPKEPVKAVMDLQKQLADLDNQIESINREKAKSLKEELLSREKKINGVRFIAEKLNVSAAVLKDIAFQLRNQEKNLFLVLGSAAGGKANLTVMISDNLVKDKNIHAGNVVKELAKSIQGGGGGQAFFASAGGTNPGGIEDALKKAEKFLEN